LNIEEAKERLTVFEREGFTFDAEKHRYSLDGEWLPSVTGLAKRYVPPFDSEKISKRVAEREGKTPEEVLAAWSAKGKVATDLGTEVHELIENYWLNQHHFKYKEGLYSDEAKKRFAAFLDYRQRKLPNLEPIAVELRLFSTRYRAAGTIDLLAYNKRDGEIYIFDWKTNGNFRDDGGFNHLYAPFDDLMENDLTKYSIQLSMYRLFLASEAGINVKGGVLLHIPPEGANCVAYHSLDLTSRLAEDLENRLTPLPEF